MRTVVIPDLHIPYNDKRATEALLRFVKDTNPARIVLLGDVVQCGAVSKFPDYSSKPMSFKDELDQGKEFLNDLTFHWPNSIKYKIDYLLGNHEERVQKYLVRNAGSLVGLEEVSIESLLKTKELGYAVYPPGTKIALGAYKDNWIAEHGDRTSSYSAYTARRMLEARGVSGISGHSHRLAAYYYSNYARTDRWIEAGHLCDISSHAFNYDTTKNWQQGFVILDNNELGKVEYKIVEIHKGKFVVDGVRYTSE